MNVASGKTQHVTTAADVAPSAEMFICVKLPSAFADGKYTASAGVQTAIGAENTYFIDGCSIDGATVTVGVIAGNGSAAGDTFFATVIALHD